VEWTYWNKLATQVSQVCVKKRKKMLDFGKDLVSRSKLKVDRGSKVGKSFSFQNFPLGTRQLLGEGNDVIINLGVIKPYLDSSTSSNRINDLSI
jgi:hypothetical protein